MLDINYLDGFTYLAPEQKGPKSLWCATLGVRAEIYRKGALLHYTVMLIVVEPHVITL
jgi:hypothetical protein